MGGQPTKEEDEANGGVAESPSSRLCAPGHNLENELTGDLKMAIYNLDRYQNF